MKEIERLTSCSEAGRMLQCSTQTVRRLIKAGELKAVRIRRCLRIPVQSIEELLASKMAELTCSVTTDGR